MCREVLVSEPYKFKARTPKRGQSWESVAQQFNGIHQPSFRYVRDRFSLLSTKYAQKLRIEERASGVEVEQTKRVLIYREKKCRRLSKERGCLTFSFPAENENVSPVFLGYGTSSSSDSSSILCLSSLI